MPWSWRRPTPPPETLPDAVLMARVVEGDEDAFAHLVSRYEHGLYNYLVRMVQDEALAADLMQETWLRVFQHAARYDVTRKLNTWLFTIASHCCLDALRMRRRLNQSAQQVRHAEADRAQGPSDPHDQILAQERLAAVRRAFQTLPEQQRSVFLLRYYHGQSYQEISAILQCPLGTVKSRLHRVVQHLQQTLSAWGYETLPDPSPQGEEKG